MMDNYGDDFNEDTRHSQVDRYDIVEDDEEEDSGSRPDRYRPFYSEDAQDRPAHRPFYDDGPPVVRVTEKKRQDFYC